jgi:flagella basal body P-ring formation protein FlgA
MELIMTPPMPPNAADIEFEEDPESDRLQEEAFGENPHLEMLELAMDGKFDHKRLKKARTVDDDSQSLYEQDASKALKQAKKMRALAAMDADLAVQNAEASELRKDWKKKTQHQAKNNAGFDRFAALRNKYTSFSAADEELTEADQEVKKEKAHTKKEPKYTAPVRYAAVPNGKPARVADSDLASGADAVEKEDWRVHQATYEALNPNSAHAKRKAEKKALKQDLKPPTPLKDAQASLHEGLDAIHRTKEIIHTPLRVLTLKMAKGSCAGIRKKADDKCKSDVHATHFYCITEGTTDTECDNHKMKDAAECKVAHETAYNQCYSLWKRAKKNINEARSKAAAPMEHTDEAVKAMSAGTSKCSTMMTKAKTECDKAFATYKGACKKEMSEAIDAEAVEISLPQMEGAGAKIAKKATKDSHNALKKAEADLKLENADSSTKKALVECNLQKNVAKRTCINAVHLARDACDKLTSSGLEDRNNQ